MLSTCLLVLSLAVPPAPAGPTPDSVTTNAAPSNLRPVAWNDQPRTRTQVQPAFAIANASPELREPFGNSRAPIVQAPRVATPLREPFTSTPRPRPTPKAATPAAADERTTLREPW